MSPLLILVAVIGALGIVVALSPIGVLGPPRPAKGEPEPGASLTRQEYFDERRLLIEARQRSYQVIEQMITGGSSGALVLSITFLEKLAPSSRTVGTHYLVTAWAFLLATLSLSLAGQYFSARGFEREVERLEATLHGEHVPDNYWARYNVSCSRISALAFIAGLALLAVFAYLNAPFQNRG